MKIKTFVVFLALIGSLSCTTVYGMINEEDNNSDAWLIDRLQRLEQGRTADGGHYFSYRDPESNNTLYYEGNIVPGSDNCAFKIVRRGLDAFKEEEILNCTTLFGKIFMFRGFSLSPDFSRIMSHYLCYQGNQNTVMMYNQSKPSDFLERAWSEQGDIPIMCCSNNGEHVAWINQNISNSDTIFHYQSFQDNHCTFNCILKNLSNLYCISRDFRQKIRSMSFNDSETQVGVRTDEYIMIIDVTKKNSEPRYYPVKYEKMYE